MEEEKEEMEEEEMEEEEKEEMEEEKEEIEEEEEEKGEGKYMQAGIPFLLPYDVLHLLETLPTRPSPGRTF
jgi:hypothetical protein